jgi:tetratricopeptide (TPR) repeat protein
MKFMKNLLILFICTNLFVAAHAQKADSASYYQQKGLEEKQARRYREAENNFAKAFQLAPSNSDLLIEWGNALVEQRRYREGREKFVQAEKAGNKNPAVIDNLATLSFNLRMWQDAINYAQKKQQAKIGTGSYFMIAKSYYELENYGEALKNCELAFKEEPNRAEVPYIAGRCFIEMSNYKRAAGCYEQAIERDSSNATWMYEAGLTFFAIPDNKKAIHWMERAAAKGYKRSNDYIENLGNAYINTGNYAKGIDLLKEVLERKPADQQLLYGIGDAHYRAAKYDAAIEYWDKVLANDKQNASALYMIGMSYQKKGDKEKGQQLCDRAIQMDPSLKNLKQERKMPGGL